MRKKGNNLACAVNVDTPGNQNDEYRPFNKEPAGLAERDQLNPVHRKPNRCLFVVAKRGSQIEKYGN